MFLSWCFKHKKLAEQVIHDDNNYLCYGGDTEFIEETGGTDKSTEQPEERAIVVEALQVYEADEEIFVELDEDERHQEVKYEHGATSEGELNHLN